MHTPMSHGLTGLLFNKICQQTTNSTVVDNGGTPLADHKTRHLQHLHDTLGFRDQDPAEQSYALLGNFA